MINGNADNPRDAIDVKQSSHDVWISHCELSNYRDGLVATRRGATNLTVSWTEFSNHRKVYLLGCDPINCPGSDESGTRVTLHHNYFHDNDYRLPWIKIAKAHIYNNYITNWSSEDDDATRITHLGEAYVERNIYRGNEDERAVECHWHITHDPPIQQGYATLIGNLLLDGAFVDPLCAPSGAGYCPGDDYSYSAEVASATLWQGIVAGSGPR